MEGMRDQLVGYRGILGRGNPQHRIRKTGMAVEVWCDVRGFRNAPTGTTRYLVAMGPYVTGERIERLGGAVYLDEASGIANGLLQINFDRHGLWPIERWFLRVLGLPATIRIAPPARGV